MKLDQMDPQFLQLFQEPVRQERDVCDRKVRRDHDEEPVDVKPVTRELHFDQFDALRTKDFTDLVRAFFVYPRGEPDHRGLRIQPREASALGDSGAGYGPKDRTAKASQGARRRQFLAATYSGAE